ncbi:acyltransferase family protein [Occallatibacter savannae]|uniref:acyltransferase family protein n=1 Tax=Occallatibacter savannae TaxID=1002691 RepID=UPI000D69AC05|nr:acyltransferase [Occallatibacter savannae]
MIDQDQRIISLDGWRGIAILMVLIDHYQTFYLRIPALPWLDLGQHGVQGFFVLSGYLITSHLLAEEHIDLKTFYVRRLFRIMPAATTFLLIVCLLRLTNGDFRDFDIFGCLLVFRNYLGQTSVNTYTAHFWSLSIEEQFYLFWPAILATAGRCRASIIAVSLIISIAIFRILNWNYYSNFYTGYMHTEIRADGLLIGCVLAIVVADKAFYARMERWARPAFWLALIVFALDTLCFHEIIPLHESVAIAVMLGATSIKPQLLVSRALECAPLKIMGAWSYSIYLWQGLFLRSTAGPAWPVLLVGSALVSYYLIEQPFRQAGRRFIARRS